MKEKYLQTPPIQVLIVEDDEDWLRGLAAFLSAEPDIEVCAEANTSEQALQAFAHHEIDVVLMDVMLANSMDGVWLTAEVTDTWKARVIMLSSMQEKETIAHAFQAGALDYLLKEDFTRIPDAVRSAYQNQVPISAKAAEAMREEFRRLKQLEQEFKTKQMQDLLTPTEISILEKVEQGYTQAQIAECFVISIRTVKVHISNILRKLGVKSSKEAAALAKQNGLFHVTDPSNRIQRRL